MNLDVDLSCPVALDKFGLLLVPTGSKLKSFLDLRNCRELRDLPEGLIVRRLWLTGSGIMRLPFRLIVEEYLDISSTDISRIPEGVTVGKALFFSKRWGPTGNCFTYIPSMGNVQSVNSML